MAQSRTKPPSVYFGFISTSNKLSRIMLWQWGMPKKLWHIFGCANTSNIKWRLFHAHSVHWNVQVFEVKIFCVFRRPTPEWKRKKNNFNGVGHFSSFRITAVSLVIANHIFQHSVHSPRCYQFNTQHSPKFTQSTGNVM